MVVKKTQRKKNKKKKTKTSRNFDSFSEKSLKKYINMIKKVRRKKVGRKKRKIGLINTMSLLNLLYNVDKERKRRPRKNLMKAHPYSYPYLMRGVDVNRIWNSTKIPASGKKTSMANSMNDALGHFVGFNLLHPLPARKLPKHQRAPVNVVPAGNNDVNVTTTLPKKPQTPPKKPQTTTLPTKPSQTPPIHYSDSDSVSVSSDSESTDSDSSDNEPLLNKRKKR